MNQYGARAQAHWRAYQPEDYLRIPEHERAAFFDRLGEGIEAAIGWRTTQAMGCQSSYSYARQRDWLRFWRLIYLPVAK